MNEDEKVEGSKTTQEIVEWMESICISITIALFIVMYVMSISSVSGSSMQPTLQDGDKIVVLPIFYSIEQGDIVVCEKNVNGVEELIVKRVIAVGGQVVDIDEIEGIVLVDGEQIYEPYTVLRTVLSDSEETLEFPLIVPEGEFFVLGDNRTVSLDSRYAEIGFVTQEELFGEVVLRIFPFYSFGIIDSGI